MQNVDDFIEKLLVEKGVTDIEPDTREELKQDMKRRLLEQINRNAILELPEDKATELAKKVEDPNFTDEQMADFLVKSGVNLTEVALDTMLKFRSFYLGVAPED